jgi:diguanylate cyclase (GGDEF)-like protein/PAS domain S-box-containing protein
VVNPTGQLVKWNTHLERLSGLTKQMINSRPMMQFFAKEDHDSTLDWIKRVMEQGSATFEADFLRFDGARIPYFCNGVVLRDTNGEVIGFTGTGRDITERKLAAEHMTRMAYFDALTGLPNRMLFSDRLQLALSSAKRDKTMMGLMFVDLDEFKPINDNYGHHIGDILLKIAASRMLECMRESDTVARIGGDEFVVMLPYIEHKEDAMYVAEKIRIALTTPFDLQEHEVQISCSVGVSIYPEHGADETTLMRQADIAMYGAKQQGRNAVHLYCEEMMDESERRQT